MSEGYCHHCEETVSRPHNCDEPEIIAACRVILAEHQCRKINGAMMDAYTASILVKVYDALNETNRAKFGALSLPVMVDVALDCIK